MVTDAMKFSDELRRQISQSLEPLCPEKAILFGSFARQVMSEGVRLL